MGQFDTICFQFTWHTILHNMLLLPILVKIIDKLSSVIYCPESRRIESV